MEQNSLRELCDVLICDRIFQRASVIVKVHVLSNAAIITSLTDISLYILTFALNMNSIIQALKAQLSNNRTFHISDSMILFFAVLANVFFSNFQASRKVCRNKWNESVVTLSSVFKFTASTRTHKHANKHKHFLMHS